MRALREIIFQTVEEPETQQVKRRVYAVLGKHRWETVYLGSDSEGAERGEFDRVHDGSKLGRCGRTIASEYIEMKEGHARVAWFTFVPHGSRGEYFHLVVTLEYDR